MADGGLPWRYCADGSVAVASAPKEVRRFGDVTHVLEHGIVTDFALVRDEGDRHGNLVYAASTQNFNPLPKLGLPAQPWARSANHGTPATLASR